MPGGREYIQCPTRFGYLWGWGFLDTGMVNSHFKLLGNGDCERLINDNWDYAVIIAGKGGSVVGIPYLHA